ncbi:MAG: PocR ligand-binding domain-containing protein [Acetobacterium sp.]
MDYKLIDIIDSDELQDLLDSFFHATGIGTAIVDIEGKIITASGWEDICSKFHRVHPATCKMCSESDVELAAQLKKGEKYNIYRCKNGLVDIAVPIFIGGFHIGNLFTGQFLLNDPDEKYFKNQAKTYGFDERLYLEALKKVKVYPEAQIKQTINFLTKLAAMIVSLGVSKKQQLQINEKISDLLEFESQLNEELIVEKVKLELLTDKLEISNKELDDFAYIASHDLREPLRGINNYASFLIEDYAELLDDDGKNMLSSISRLAGRLDEFISSLLYYSRLGRTAIVRSDMSLKEIIDDVIELFEFSINERPTVITIQENQPVIIGDSQNTIEIYRNLIGNALKYNDKSERIIEIGYFYSEERPEHPVLYVKDNGIGIEEKYFEKIFMIFKRLHPREKFGGGTGAGLTIVKKCIDLLNGKIWIESKIGQGTTFFFEITEEKGQNHWKESDNGK